MKQHWKFFASAAAALVWLWASAALAVPWVRGAALHLPFVYVVFVVAGVALLPAYLMGAMFLSNLLHRKLPPRFHPGCRPVSVIVCARNEEKGIYGTIGSIARQEYDGRVTILCVDNGSTDGTLAEMRRAAADFSRPGRVIRLYGCCEPGKARALNEGLRHVRDEYFVTVDADTRLEKSALSAIVGRIAATGAGCVAGNLVSAGARTWVQKMQFWDYFVSIAAIKRYQGSYGATLVAQGAFSAYETAAVRAAGGWTDGAGEDIVLTYRLLAAGRRSLYEPRAVGFTDVPATLGALARQRSRWARGMFEGLAAVKPWSQPDAFAGYFETLNLSIVWLDLAYIFGFVPGVALALLGMPWLAGWLTLLVLPLMLIGTASVCRFQRRLPEMEAKGSAWGFLLFVLVFQVVQSACSLWGYAAALTRRGIDWKR